MRFGFPTDDAAATSRVWETAADSLAERLKGGQDVAFITEGDPMLFSTFSYVLESIRANHPDIAVEIIPGVSSVMAAAARASVPLVTHGQRLAILPAVYGIDDLREAIANYDTIVLMKVNRVLLDALANLESLGLAGKGIYVGRATTEREQGCRIAPVDRRDWTIFPTHFQGEFDEVGKVYFHRRGQATRSCYPEGQALDRDCDLVIYADPWSSSVGFARRGPKFTSKIWTWTR